MATASVFDLTIPPVLEASEPPEARGLRRDDVRLMISDLRDGTIHHERFRDLPRWLERGDVLVVNASGTMNAAVAATAAGHGRLTMHVSTALPGGFWTVEVRRPDGAGSTKPYRAALAGTMLMLPDGGRATLLAPYPWTGALEAASRLWIAALALPEPVPDYLARVGSPIRYPYVKRAWPSAMVQTVFATELGSAEMPSAGRPFTAELVARLVSSGVEIVPIVLHTGVASLEDHEPPYEEIYRVPAEAADRVNAARRAGHRVIAVGTTVVRALETVTDARGRTSAGEGWTRLVITADRPLRSIDGLITGFHEPRATHLAIVERAVAAAARSTAVGDPSGHLARAYAEARAAGYLWHEFGDAHLILGGRRERDGEGIPSAPASIRLRDMSKLPPDQGGWVRNPT